MIKFWIAVLVKSCTKLSEVKSHKKYWDSEWHHASPQKECLKSSEGIYIFQIRTLHCQASNQVWSVNKAISDVQELKKQKRKQQTKNYLNIAFLRKSLTIRSRKIRANEDRYIRRQGKGTKKKGSFPGKPFPLPELGFLWAIWRAEMKRQAF